MSRTKLVLSILAVVVVSAVGAVGASTASATFTLEPTACPGGAIVTICWETTVKGTELKEFKGSEEISSKLTPGTESLLEVASLELHITCTTVTNTEGEFVQTAPLTTAATIKGLEVDFTNCTVLEPYTAKCSVTEPILWKAMGGVFGTEDPLNDVVLKPEAGTEFTTFVFKSKAGQTCPATLTAVSVKFTGELLCTLPEIEEDLLVHLLLCKHNETTSLLFAEKPATFEIDQELTLKNNTTDAWDITALG
jgi:hypothetical protein